MLDFHAHLHVLVEGEVGGVGGDTATGYDLGAAPEPEHALVSVEDTQGLPELHLPVAGLQVRLPVRESALTFTVSRGYMPTCSTTPAIDPVQVNPEVLPAIMCAKKGVLSSRSSHS